MKTYARKINEGNDNEEYSIRTDYSNQTGYIDFNLDLAIPESPTGTLILSTTDEDGNQTGGIRIASVVVPKLVNLRNGVRDLYQYLVKNDNGELHACVFICHHDDVNHLKPDEVRIAI